MSNPEADMVPEGWQLATLADVATLVTGTTPSRKDIANYTATGGLPWVKPGDLINWEPITTAQEYLSSTGATASRLLPPESVLVSCIGNLGKVGFAGTRLATNQQITSVSFQQGVVVPRFGLYWCCTLREWLESNSSETTIRIINKSRFGEGPIRIPPLAEQRRIVAKVEQILARVNAARERLGRVPATLKRFRQSVLAAACSGRLTADWRKVNPQSSGTGAMDTLAEIRRVDTSALPDLPETWGWIYLPDTGEMSRGRSRNRPRNAPHLYGGPYPFIQTGDIANSGGRITSHTQTYSEEGLAQSRLWPSGTVCISIAANIADSATLTYPACFPDSVVGIVTIPTRCLNEYLEFFLRTAREDLAAFAPATAQANINIAILNDVAVPLPPLPEQREIVRRVSALFALADGLEAKLAAARKRVDALTQAVLAKAFRGELVPTEAELARAEGRTYEPASALLGRLRAERASAPKVARRRK